MSTCHKQNSRIILADFYTDNNRNILHQMAKKMIAFQLPQQTTICLFVKLHKKEPMSTVSHRKQRQLIFNDNAIISRVCQHTEQTFNYAREKISAELLQN